MRTFKIATWNVNSLRVRLTHLLTWLNDVKPDVIALQEIKLVDNDFPFDVLREAGYAAISSGQKTYNGVAFLMNNHEQSIDVVTSFPNDDDPQRRLLAMTLFDIRVLNLYIPNGQSVASDKYQYKLNWLSKLDELIKNEIKKYPKLIILGDFNIAPQDIDVHDPAQWEGSVLVSDGERIAFNNLLQIGLTDCYRKLNPDEKNYSWWDYRMNAYRRNLGLRIDHILCSDTLSNNCKKCYIDKAPRGWERPSDHAPVVAEFEIEK